LFVSPRKLVIHQNSQSCRFVRIGLFVQAHNILQTEYHVMSDVISAFTHSFQRYRNSVSQLHCTKVAIYSTHHHHHHTHCLHCPTCPPIGSLLERKWYYCTYTFTLDIIILYQLTTSIIHQCHNTIIDRIEVYLI